MRVRIHDAGVFYSIEAPSGSRVVRTSGEDCLVYRHDDRTEYVERPEFVGASLSKPDKCS